MSKKTNFHILIIDDEADFSASLEEWFNSQGYDVKVASSGFEALELLNTVAPKVILLDIYMPGMDGIQTLLKIRKFNSSVPVILLASKLSEEVRLEGYKAGANGFLDKTLDFYKIEHIINSIVRVVVREKRPISKAKSNLIKNLKHSPVERSPALVIIAAVFIVLFWLSTSPFAKVCYKDKCLSVELAATDSQRQKGLMFRKDLPEGRAMLFIFPKEDYYGFWMKNTLIPLDILWINKDKKIVGILRNARPCVVDNGMPCPAFKPTKPSKYVLEVNAGFVDQNGLKTGDELTFSGFISK